ncbi:adenylate/guanylate cyclase domain-containing protein [Paraburkholderia sp. HD33-4]|uniref:adenylate/guanylate cyclase domain-containing protein n=1 Tax=Paraburkholderia sp. HD33-4 TaxID=2883242 RepID=UPI001F423602|nr:adenylate/guanylate cyclase domain-containing protein [Paraburkholderia sp. HD33-4]
MRCTRCGFENPSGVKFCEECGAKVRHACPACGHEISANARFCGECGAPTQRSSAAPDVPLIAQAPVEYTPPHLAARIRSEFAAIEARGDADGERKTITALFADIASSTALINDLDPEEARRLIDPVLALMMRAVHHYEGYVAKSMGDGILALFGAPIAHEDHAQRALYAALRMQDEMRSYADRVRLAEGITLQIRVGVNSGEVVVRGIRYDDLHADYDPVGHSINIASRMESIALPGSIVASEHTHKLAEGYIAFKTLGATPIKGLSKPLTVFEVQGLGPLRTRLQIAASRGLARFVGRKDELAQLEHAFTQAAAGHGQIVGVVGEPGVGKSRLFYEFKLHPPGECLVLETFSVSHGRAYPYLPLIELLKDYCQISMQDDERRRREKITGKVLTLDSAMQGSLPYFFHLIGVTDSGSALAQMDPHIRRLRMFEAITRLLVRESLDHPIVLIVEDLQWLDSESAAFLDFLCGSVTNTRILLLVNYRPEYRHDWGHKSHYTQLWLNPLGEGEADELLSTLLGNATEFAVIKQLILEKTEGNPFFIEEVVQTLIEEGVLRGGLGQYQLQKNPVTLHIPTTVQGVLAARIDRLAPLEKTLLQTLAVIGKTFRLSLLVRVVDEQEDDLRSGLARLKDGEFIFEQPSFPEVEYTFKHALTQEVVYGSLLSERRHTLHERTAQAIESLSDTHLEEHYSELAHHFSRSGNSPKAVEYLHYAGRQALQRSANAEAVTHFTTALALLDRLPENRERAVQELELQITLGPALMAARGIGASEVEKTYTRALALCRQLGETDQLFPALLGLRTFFIARGAVRPACELGEELVTLARKAHDPALLMQAHRALGSSLLHLGELEAARAQLEEALALYDPQQQYSLAFFHGIEPGVLAPGYLSQALWFLGYPDQALAHSQRALALAQTLCHPAASANALIYAAELHLCRREVQLTHDLADSVLSLATEHGFPFWSSYGTVLLGWSLAEEGRTQEGIERMREGLAAHRETGAQLLTPHFLALLAEAYGRTGQAEAGLQALTEALDAVDQTDARVNEAELYRLKGELTLRLLGQETVESEGEGEASFLRAVAIARRQGARSLQLRAVTALARLWRQQGKSSHAREILSTTYGSFSEGFDTRDLQEAKTLLDELGGK